MSTNHKAVFCNFLKILAKLFQSKPSPILNYTLNGRVWKDSNYLVVLRCPQKSFVTSTSLIFQNSAEFVQIFILKQMNEKSVSKLSLLESNDSSYSVCMNQDPM